MRYWTDEEKAIVRANPEMDVHVLAAKLDRTWQAVSNMRWRMSPEHKPENADFDKRPSGWYGEMIGTYLMECEDAWTSWKHYHRYVEIKVAASDPYGWTTLLCRRDADAA